MPSPQDFQSLIGTATLSIGSAGSVSGAVQLNGAQILGLVNLGTWTPSNLSFEHALTDPAGSGVIWTTVADIGGPSTVPSGALITTGGTITVLLATNSVLRGLNFVRVRSGMPADNGGTLQTAARSLILLTRPQ